MQRSGLPGSKCCGGPNSPATAGTCRLCDLCALLRPIHLPNRPFEPQIYENQPACFHFCAFSCPFVAVQFQFFCLKSFCLSVPSVCACKIRENPCWPLRLGVRVCPSS